MNTFNFKYFLLYGIPTLLIMASLIPNWEIIINVMEFILVVILLGGVIFGITCIYNGFIYEEPFGYSLEHILFGSIILIICGGFFLGIIL